MGEQTIGGNRKFELLEKVVSPFWPTTRESEDCTTMMRRQDVGAAIIFAIVN